MLDTKRKKLIDEYLSLQSDFEVLFKKKLVRHLIIKESKKEWIDDNGNELNKKKDKPVKREYTKYYLLPGVIGEGPTETSLSIDDLSTKELKQCNDLIKEKLELYSDYLHKDSKKKTFFNKFFNF